RRKQILYQILGILFEHARCFPVGIAMNFTAVRVRSVAIDAGELQGEAVGQGEMPNRQANRVIWGDRVELVTREESLLLELRYRMPHTAADPFTSGRACHHLRDAREGFGNAADAVERHGVFQEPGRLDMRVRVDQARDDSLALRIQDLGLGAGETANACLIADADDLAIL